MKIIVAILFLLLYVSAYAENKENDGKWKVARSKSAMDDSKTINLILEAENYVEGWLESKRPDLFIRCRENKTEVFIDIGMSASVEHGLYQQHTVRIRLDDNKPFKERWSESTDGNALFAPRSISLAKKIADSNRMIFEFTPFNSNPALVRFDTKGLKPLLKEVADTCHWSYNP